MNDPFTNHDHEDEVAERLSRVAEHTNASSQFAANLEEKLRDMHQPKRSWLGVTFRRISPTVRWAAVMVLLGLVLSWSIRSLVPPPQPAAENTPGLPAVTTPTPQATAPGPTAAPTESGGYDWRGGKLFLSEPLPASPAEANVYLLQPDQPATVEEARALAQRFGVEGEIYEAPGDLPDTTRYMITDGRQRLYVRSENYFTYYAEYNPNTFLLAAKDLSDEDAYAAIDSFLKSRGFDFEYQVENESGLPGVYDVLPLTPDAHTIRFDHNMPARLQFTLGSGGQVISLDSSQIDYESVGAYGIRSAEEAFQLLLGNAETTQNGVLESSRSGGVLNESYWERSYPDGQTVTIYGRITSFPSVEPGKPPFVAIDQHTVTGNTPPASDDQIIAATGQFHTEDGIRTFQVESWQPADAQETAVMGTLQREGDQTILISDMGEKYVIADAPAEVPLNTVPPDEQLMISGFLVNGDLVWRAIQYFPAGSNFGGGGGGGTGFYKLNLSGTPVPFPTPTMQPETGQGNREYVVQEGDTCGNIASGFGVSIQNLIDANQLSAECLIMVGQTLTIPGAEAQSPLVGRQLEKQRGMLSINIYRGQDGISRPEFTYLTQLGDTYLYATLENVTLDEMLPYQNRPVDIWGTVKSADAYGTAVITVDRIEDPYPGLQFQIIRGTQQHSEVNGNPVVLFTAEDGKAYVQMTRDGGLDTSIVGEVGDLATAEVLILPDETFGGYPVMRFFRIDLGAASGNGEPADMQISADKPQVMDASLDPQTYTPPDTTIETVEFVYYLPDPRYAIPDATATPQYLQPAWRFAGHRSNGDVFEILVQALQQDYLLPELQTYTPPG
jgi:LysM repeat protein